MGSTGLLLVTTSVNTPPPRTSHTRSRLHFTDALANPAWSVSLDKFTSPPTTTGSPHWPSRMYRGQWVHACHPTICCPQRRPGVYGNSQLQNPQRRGDSTLDPVFAFGSRPGCSPFSCRHYENSHCAAGIQGMIHRTAMY